jgi:hypothetical protein
LALLNAVGAAMPQYPMGQAFEAALPRALIEPFGEWEAQRPQLGTRWQV